MEHRELFALVIAACFVVLVIAILNMASAKNKLREEQKNTQIEPAVTTAVITTKETDIWDVLHDQQTTTTTVITDEFGQAVTEETATTVTDAFGQIVTVESAAETQTNEFGNDVITDVTLDGTVTDTVTSDSVTETVTALTAETQPGYTLVIP